MDILRTPDERFSNLPHAEAGLERTVLVACAPATFLSTTEIILRHGHRRP